MNIVFFVTSLNSGGIENYLLRFLRENHKKFNKIYVWCKSGQDGQLDDAYSELENVSLVKLKLGYFDIASYQSLKEFLINNNIESACDFTGNFAGRVLLTAKKAGICNRVAFYRSAKDTFSATKFKAIYNNWVKRLVRKHATHILSNSKAAFDYFYQSSWHNDKRYQVIYNGLKQEEFTGVQSNLRSSLNIPKEAFVVGHTGRFNEAKNHTTIIEVAKVLTAKHPDIYFILCGNGVKSNLTNTVAKAGLTDRVILFENRTDIPVFLNTMDCYFFPSIYEGQPNALIEAMLVGLPYIASNIAPIVETVPSQQNLYSPMDINAFVDAIEWFYFKKIEQKGFKRVTHQGIERKFNAQAQFGKFYSVLICR